MSVKQLITILNNLIMKGKVDPDSKVVVEYLDEEGRYCDADLDGENTIIRGDGTLAFDITEIQDRMWGVR